MEGRVMLNRRDFVAMLASVPLLGKSVSTVAAAFQAQLSSTPGQHFNGFHFGWIPDIPRLKVNVYAQPVGAVATLPKSVDLRPTMPQVYDQGQIGSCTSNAIAAAVQFVRRKSGQPPDFQPSRLFIYYNGRITENSLGSDSGLSISDGIRAVEEYGVCPETEWPYDSPPADVKGNFPTDSRAVLKPRSGTFSSAYTHRAIEAFSFSGSGADRLASLKGCLADGFPFAFGFTIYRSFFDAQKRPLTTIPVPPNTDLAVGGHAVLAVGYDDKSRNFTCRNSWGLTDSTGMPVQDKGHFYMPYEYLLNDDLAADFWTIRTVYALQ
jgi:C1A family cysteine protease